MKNLFSKFTFIVSIIVCITGTFLVGCSNGTTDWFDPRPIVCLGDSITEGFGASFPLVVDRSKSYPAFLGKRVKVAVVNAGVTGDTTTDALARVPAEVLSKRPQLVIIMVGANDVFATKSVSAAGGAMAAVKGELQKIIDAVKADNRKIYLANQFGPDTMPMSEVIPVLAGVKTFFNWETTDTDEDFYHLFMSYREMLRTLAADNDIDFIDDIWTGVINRHMSDFMHPNANGYAIMAYNIFNAIKPYLESKNLLN
jgi:acyl-CoA thioesterase-1